MMDRAVISLTAVYVRRKHGYIGFVEELPGVNSHGQTIEEARENLQHQATAVFDWERAQSAELLKGDDVVREQFRVPIPKSRSSVGHPARAAQSNTPESPSTPAGS